MIKVGAFSIYVENRNGFKQAICPNCGTPLTFSHLQKIMPAAETGLFYCSDECSKEHVEKKYKGLI